MFPPRLQRIVDSLAELGEAMLRPEDALDLESERTTPRPAPHPHRRALPAHGSRAAHTTRRAGTSMPREQHCVSPVVPPAATPSRGSRHAQSAPAR